jgi:L-galactose dehydrogenase
MEYRKLGRTELETSALGFGTGPLGDLYGIADPAEINRAVGLAIDHGINFFDSSPYYGLNLSETRLGDALVGRRHKVILATKAGRYGLHDFDFSAKRLLASVDESLRRLKTDHIDLYQAHDVEFGDFQQIVGETVPALRKIQDSGKARYIGITGYPPTFLLKIAQQAPVDTILSYCHYDLLNTSMDETLTPFAKTNGVGLINASALHMGILTEEGAPKWHPGPREVHEAARRVLEICRRRNLPLPGVALRFAFDHPYVSSTLVGMKTQAEVLANLEFLRMKSDPPLFAEIRASLGAAFNIEWLSGKPENNV